MEDGTVSTYRAAVCSRLTNTAWRYSVFVEVFVLGLRLLGLARDMGMAWF
ncbi:hypothetical protein AGMMS49974_05410 [Deltaproteobacteria bacterium]|nr:hypothetical protein AGMMS49974_05410 [Deltaproteobacteria bacterium]GHU98380.1 hypothetical protein AGMMS50248_04870 [Deltaproteobacteria bacterium]